MGLCRLLKVTTKCFDVICISALSFKPVCVLLARSKQQENQSIRCDNWVTVIVNKADFGLRGQACEWLLRSGSHRGTGAVSSLPPRSPGTALALSGVLQRTA